MASPDPNGRAQRDGQGLLGNAGHRNERSTAITRKIVSGLALRAPANNTA